MCLTSGSASAFLVIGPSEKVSMGPFLSNLNSFFSQNSSQSQSEFRILQLFTRRIYQNQQFSAEIPILISGTVTSYAGRAGKFPCPLCKQYMNGILGSSAFQRGAVHVLVVQLYRWHLAIGLTRRARHAEMGAAASPPAGAAAYKPPIRSRGTRG